MEGQTQDANAQDSGWNADGSLPPDMDPDGEVSSDSQKPIPGIQPASSTSAETLTTEQQEPEESGEEGEPAQETSEPEETAEEAQAEDDQPPFHTHPRWQEMVQQAREKDTRLAELEAKMQQLEDQANFYATQYNEAVGLNQVKGTEKQDSQQQTPPATTTPQSQVLTPEKWESQTHIADWTKSQIEESYKSTVEPNMQRLAQQLGALMEFAIKSKHEDYDDVVKSAYEDVFNLDPMGKATGLKNQALFNYFQAHPFPHLAMYEHGLRKSAGTRIKQGVQQATKQTLKKLTTKPKGPTKPAAASSAADKKSYWDSSEWEAQPGKRTDKELQEAGLL